MTLVDPISERGDDFAIEVRHGRPTEEELAALIAVVSEAYAVEVAATVVEDATEAAPWRRTQRALRTPIRRDVAWGRFIG